MKNKAAAFIGLTLLIAGGVGLFSSGRKSSEAHAAYEIDTFFVTAVDDSYANGNASYRTTNYGTQTGIQLNYSDPRTGWIRWIFGASDTLPDSVFFVGAKLRLFCYSNLSPGRLITRKACRAFDESDMCGLYWDATGYKSFSSYCGTSAGACATDMNSADSSGADINNSWSSNDTILASSYMYINLDSTYVANYSGIGDTVAVMLSTGDALAAVYSSEYATDTEKRPKLMLIVGIWPDAAHEANSLHSGQSNGNTLQSGTGRNNLHGGGQ